MNLNKQRGAVSLFIVVFAALLMTVVTVSFVRQMISSQQQASSNDLSQSAYDSAQAGTEDAKRLLIFDQTCQAQNSATQACTDAHNAIASGSCSTIANGLNGVTGPVAETLVQQSAGDKALDQAYTCVKIALQTDDYIGSLDANASTIIPLVGSGAFDTVKLEWFNTPNLQAYNGTVVDLTNTLVTPEPLLAQSSWKPNRPSIMRTQLMQFSSAGFKLSDFDSTNASGQSNANTLFLYPMGISGQANNSPDPAKSFTANDARRSALTGNPTAVTCSGNLSLGGYACTATLTLPQPISGGSRVAFLRLSSLYNGTNYRLTLSNSGSAVQFNGVQPLIDSTGRANNLFRRVSTRVTLSDANFPYPQAAVDVTGNLCKDFVVTDKTTDYKNNCTP